MQFARRYNQTCHPCQIIVSTPLEGATASAGQQQAPEIITIRSLNISTTEIRNAVAICHYNNKPTQLDNRLTHAFLHVHGYQRILPDPLKH